MTGKYISGDDSNAVQGVKREKTFSCNGKDEWIINLGLTRRSSRHPCMAPRRTDVCTPQRTRSP